MVTNTTHWRGEPKRDTEEKNGGLLIALTQRFETIQEEKGGCKVYLFWEYKIFSVSVCSCQLKFEYIVLKLRCKNWETDKRWWRTHSVSSLVFSWNIEIGERSIRNFWKLYSLRSRYEDVFWWDRYLSNI